MNRRICVERVRQAFGVSEPLASILDRTGFASLHRRGAASRRCECRSRRSLLNCPGAGFVDAIGKSNALIRRVAEDDMERTETRGATIAIASACVDRRGVIRIREEGGKMRMTSLFIATMTALLVGACTTTTPAERRSADEARCRSYGFRHGTDAFAKCLLDVDLDRAAERRSRFDYPYGFGGPARYWARPW